MVLILSMRFLLRYVGISYIFIHFDVGIAILISKRKNTKIRMSARRVEWIQYNNHTHQFNPFTANHSYYRFKPVLLTLSGLNLSLSSSSTTSRELLPQFSTCSGWRWLEVDDKLKKITMYS